MAVSYVSWLMHPRMVPPPKIGVKCRSSVDRSHTRWWFLLICVFFKISPWKNNEGILPSLKLTNRPWKWMVGRWNVLWGWLIFRCELLVSGNMISAYILDPGLLRCCWTCCPLTIPGEIWNMFVGSHRWTSVLFRWFIGWHVYYIHDSILIIYDYKLYINICDYIWLYVILYAWLYLNIDDYIWSYMIKCDQVPRNQQVCPRQDTLDDSEIDQGKGEDFCSSFSVGFGPVWVGQR